MTSLATKFEAWADDLKFATQSHLENLEARKAVLVSEKNFITNRVTALISLEEATPKDQAMEGLLVSGNELQVLKEEVCTYTSQVWREASQEFQKQLAKPFTHFRSWFEFAREATLWKENERIHKELEDVRSQLEAEKTKEFCVCVSKSSSVKELLPNCLSRAKETQH